MPTVRYTVINGEVIAEKRNGVRRLYVPDPLGSTVALVDNTQTITDRFGYWPYGEEASRTGTTPTPFRFVGTQGYYRDRLNSVYVRRRHYRPDVGRWTTPDPLERYTAGADRYGYSASSPVARLDPSGYMQVPPPDTKYPLPLCLGTCNGLQGDLWAVCMLQCLLKHGKKQYHYCAYVYCLAFPSLEVCHYGLDPCASPKRRWEFKDCDCCEITYQCCLRSADNPKQSGAVCMQDHTKCMIKYDCEDVPFAQNTCGPVIRSA